MEKETKDENLEETPEEEPEETPEEKPEETEETPEEKPQEEPSEETESEPTIKETYELAKALQKGYTLNRQDMATIRDNQDKIQEALETLGKKDDTKDEYGVDKPFTVKDYMELRKQEREQVSKEKDKIDRQINSQIDELKAQGLIKSQEDEDELFLYAKKHKMTNLIQAAGAWNEVREAQKGKEKAKAKTGVKKEAGSKVGTSQKTKTEVEQGFDYDEIHSKDMDELAEG